MTALVENGDSNLSLLVVRGDAKINKDDKKQQKLIEIFLVLMLSIIAQETNSEQNLSILVFSLHTNNGFLVPDRTTCWNEKMAW